jgi:hypothetical protein
MAKVPAGAILKRIGGMNRFITNRRVSCTATSPGKTGCRIRAVEIHPPGLINGCFMPLIRKVSMEI